MKMTSNASDINNISSKRLILKPHTVLEYLTVGNSRYETKYALRCLGIRMKGSQKEMTDAIEQAGISFGSFLIEPLALGKAITIAELDYCPLYLLKSYLRKNQLSIDGRKEELVRRARELMDFNDEKTIIPTDFKDNTAELWAFIKICHDNAKFRIKDIDIYDALTEHGYEIRVDDGIQSAYNPETGEVFPSDAQARPCNGEKTDLFTVTNPRNVIPWAYEYAKQHFFDMESRYDIADVRTHLVKELIPYILTIALNIRERCHQIIKISKESKKTIPPQFIEEMRRIEERLNEIRCTVMFPR